MAEATSSGPSGASSSSEKSVPTVSSTLHETLSAHLASRPALSTPFLHPYAPVQSGIVDRKGKGRADSSPAETPMQALGSVLANIKAARAVIESSTKEDSRNKLGLALREVSNLQASLLPTSQFFRSLSGSSKVQDNVIPSSLVSLHPVELLKHLASSLGIQAYLEDSQFGLLKTQLALAGKAFVIDVDLETDAVGGEEDEEMDQDNPSTSRPTISQANGDGTANGAKGSVGEEREGKGRVRWSAISAMNIKDDSTRKSEWIALVLQERIEGYLKAWNDKSVCSGIEPLIQVEKQIRALKKELQDLSFLDKLAEAESTKSENVKDWFADLENIHSELKSLVGSEQLYKPCYSSIFPSFALLTPSPTTLESPLEIRFRPTMRGESIPSPITSSSNDQPWLSGTWILEIYPSSSRVTGKHGIAVTRDWLNEASISASQNSIPMENLLYESPITDTTSVNFLPAKRAIGFPYASNFIHQSKEAGSLQQRWAMVETGPECFVVGRLGIPTRKVDLTILLQLLRKQLVLNELFSQIFDTRRLETDTDQAEDGAMTAEDLFSDAAAIPITVRILDGAVSLTLPAPHHLSDDTPVLDISLKVAGDKPYVSADLKVRGSLGDSATQTLQTVVDTESIGLNLVSMISRVDIAMSGVRPQ